jgi:hypothetical protein
VVAWDDGIKVCPIAEISPALAFNSNSWFRDRPGARFAYRGCRFTDHLRGNSTDEGRFESIAP